jgi:hypothetical protein
MYASRGIRTYDPSTRADEDISCLGPREHCDRQKQEIQRKIYLRMEAADSAQTASALLRYFSP